MSEASSETKARVGRVPPVGSGAGALVPSVLLALLAAVAGATPVAAQASSAAAFVPVVERFDPASGARTRLTAGGLTSARIRAIQAALERRGLGPDRRSGRWDAATRSALLAFQHARHLEACGCASYATVVALGLEPRVVETVVSAAGGPSFAHPTIGPPVTVSGGGGPAAGPGVRVGSEAGVVVVRGSGTDGAERWTGRPPPPAPAAAGRDTTRTGTAARPSEAWPSPYAFEPIFGVPFLPRARRRGRRRTGGHAGERPPIPYAPRLPGPLPGPGLPTQLPPPPRTRPAGTGG